MDVSSLLDNVVQPQVAKIHSAQTDDEIFKLAQGVNIIIGQRYSIIEELMKSCIESDELSHNEAMFVADIYQINDLVQENVKDLVLMCARRLSKDGAKVLVEAQKQKLLENIHPCYEILAKLITFDEQNE